jgi:hypothetical protein
MLIPQVPDLPDEQIEELEKMREEFAKSIDGGKVFRTPVLKDSHSHWSYEAFEMMHKQDGTSNGRRKCDFSL